MGRPMAKIPQLRHDAANPDGGRNQDREHDGVMPDHVARPGGDPHVSGPNALQLFLERWDLFEEAERRGMCRKQQHGNCEAEGY